LDEVFAYKTIKVVRMLDRRLGFVYYGIQLLIVVYILVFVFGINEGYLASEMALGQVYVRVMGATYAKIDGVNVPFDAHDLRTPSMENGALFVTTKIEAVKQTRNECVNPEYACAVDTECPMIEGVSTQKCDDGLCVMKGWCPGISNDASETSVMRMERPEDLIVWFRSAISFPVLLENTTFSSMNREEPTLEGEDGITDAWTLEQLLDMAGAPVTSVREDGALLNIQLTWECMIDSLGGCTTPKINVLRMDEGKVRGFSYFFPNYIFEPSLDVTKDVRILQKLTGVRVIVTAEGLGKKFSILATVLQLSSGLALLSLANIVTDFLMLRVMPERDHYRKYKEELTPDFSDLRDKVQENEGVRMKIRGLQNRYQVQPNASSKTV